jgi:hypothetical protein
VFCSPRRCCVAGTGAWGKGPAFEGRGKRPQAESPGARLLFRYSPRACRSPDPAPPRPYSSCVGRPAFIGSSDPVIALTRPKLLDVTSAFCTRWNERTHRFTATLQFLAPQTGYLNVFIPQAAQDKQVQLPARRGFGSLLALQTSPEKFSPTSEPSPVVGSL